MQSTADIPMEEQIARLAAQVESLSRDNERLARDNAELARAASEAMRAPARLAEELRAELAAGSQIKRSVRSAASKSKRAAKKLMGRG